MVGENVNNMKNKLACHSGQRQLLASSLLGDTHDQYSERTLSETLLVEREHFNSSSRKCKPAGSECISAALIFRIRTIVDMPILPL